MKWYNINLYIKNVLSNKAYLLFDNTQYLGRKNELHIAMYGGHPNEEGCKVWADALYEQVKTHLMKH